MSKDIRMDRGILLQIRDAELSEQPFESCEGITWPDVNDFFEAMFDSALEDKDNKKIRYTARVVGDDGRIYFYEDDKLVFVCSPETEEQIKEWAKEDDV